MYKTACPACGAQVEFKSAGSVMAVCAYCRSTLLRDADTVRNIGRMSEVIEDHTRIQITTSGIYEGKVFGVVGRIQLRYEDGFWNEWYLLFDDGSVGWLSDGSGQYVITLPRGKANKAPSFARIKPGAAIPWDGQRFMATDVRTARCVAGEGELPFAVGEGWEARVADFRSGDRFLTLDYSEGETPEVFVGLATSLEALKCLLLRSADQVEDKAGKLAGKARALECPNCGSAIDTVPGQAEHLVCPSCHAEVALNEDKAEVLKKHADLEKVVTSLQLGDLGKFDGISWRIIGLLRQRETGEDGGSVWTEYLLFNAEKGFLWLVETSSGWTRTEVLNTLPEESGSGVKFKNRFYTSKWNYEAEVIYAAGAFNWRVAIGDKTWLVDYDGPDGTLSQETTAAEMTWSLGKPIKADELAKAFGKEARLLDKGSAGSVVWQDSPLKNFAKYASYAAIALNIFHLSGIMSFIVLGLAILLLWVPVWSSSGLTGGDEA